MADSALRNLRGLVLSAVELRALTDWPEALIEDYLNIIDNLVNVAGIVDEKNDIIKAVTIIDASMSPYEITESDEDVFFDTTDGDIVANLRPGSNGRNYRLLNVGTAKNKVVLNPFGTELLFGENLSENIYDAEALLITFNSTYGWY